MMDLVSLTVFLTAVAFVALYLTLKYLRVQLREPKKGQFEAVALAYKNKAAIPPAFKTPQLRRQLILGSTRPAELTNLLDMRVRTFNPSAEKKPLIYGFLHPNAAKGGGGERVLWAAVKQLMTADKSAVAAIYFGAQPELTPASMLKLVADRYHIEFSAEETNRIVLIALTQAWLVDPNTYLMLTLISQAVGMAVLGYEAVSNLMPDVLVDTTGLAFSYPIVSWFAKIPIIAYVHYPFVQTEMLQAIRAQGLAHPKRLGKYVYYKMLTSAYRWAGSFATVGATNSTWTKQHLGWKQAKEFKIVYPPSAVQDFPDPATLKTPDGKPVKRAPAIVYLAQFRPEKRHDLAITAFAKTLGLAKKDHSIPSANRKPHLILLGSVRDEVDALYVHSLRRLAATVGLTESEYTIVENAPWGAITKIMESALIGINAMWNEHFGMGVVENMAAGLIPVVHASAGPYLDIVRDAEGAPGFFFRSKRDPDGLGLQGFPTFSTALLSALRLSDSEQARYRERAYRASQRFSDGAFAEAWGREMETVTALVPQFRQQRKSLKLFD